jgi:hypothetical protein
MFLMRVGLGELLVVGGLVVVLILVPLLAYWRSRRMSGD